MNPLQPKSHGILKRIVLLFGVVTVASVVLVACGGGDTRQVPEASPDKQATAVPPAWKPRVPTSEVINGITVPLEPSPTVNNSTLAGVDSNSNGVRDDVERIIARKVSNVAGFNRGLTVARAYQHLLTTATVSQKDSDSAMLEAECFVYRNLTDPVGIKSAEIKNATFNTPERLEDLRRKALYLLPRITDTKHECT